MIKLIALDLDDTTLDSQHQITVENKAAIKEALAKNIKVTIATGRMFQAALPIARELGILGPIITYNGAITRDTESGEIIKEFRLDFDKAKWLLNYANEHKLMVQSYMNDTLIVDRINAENAVYALICKVPVLAVGDIAAYWQEAPTKILYAAPSEQLAVAWSDLSEKFGKDIYITKSKSFYLEIINPAANKGVGVQAIAQELGIKKEEIMVCGDSLNDMELFNAAGLKVAMGNALPELKAKADFVTLSNDESGVAYAIRKFAL